MPRGPTFRHAAAHYCKDEIFLSISCRRVAKGCVARQAKACIIVMGKTDHMILMRGCGDGVPFLGPGLDLAHAGAAMTSSRLAQPGVLKCTMKCRR
jgi:hypothetical protein